MVWCILKRKIKRKILYFQTINIGLFTISSLILGEFSGAKINVIRNILYYKDKSRMREKIIMDILSHS